MRDKHISIFCTINILSYRNFNKPLDEEISAFGRNSDSPYPSGKRLDQIGRFRYDPALWKKGSSDREDSARGLKARVPIWFLMLFLLGGCVPAHKVVSLKAVSPEVVSPTMVTRQETMKKIMDDVLVFLDLQQIDLDKDGEKEIVAIYTTGVNSTGVKVIKFSRDIGSIIFERIFSTPNTKFEVKKGIPTLIVYESNYVRGFSRLRKVYRWDGKSFKLEERR